MEMHICTREQITRTKYARTGEWKLRFTINMFVVKLKIIKTC